jgi:hypothetical protein
MIKLCVNILKSNTVLNVLITTLWTTEIVWRWNGAFKELRWRGKTKVLGENISPSVMLFTDNPTLIDLGWKTGFCGDKPLTNRMSQGTINTNYSFFLQNVTNVWV